MREGFSKHMGGGGEGGRAVHVHVVSNWLCPVRSAVEKIRRIAHKNGLNHKKTYLSIFLTKIQSQQTVLVVRINLWMHLHVLL